MHTTFCKGNQRTFCSAHAQKEAAVASAAPHFMIGLWVWLLRLYFRALISRSEPDPHVLQLSIFQALKSCQVSCTQINFKFVSHACMRMHNILYSLYVRILSIGCTSRLTPPNVNFVPHAHTFPLTQDRLAVGTLTTAILPWYHVTGQGLFVCNKLLKGHLNLNF